MIVGITIIEDDLLYFRLEGKGLIQLECTPEIGKALKTISEQLVRKDKVWGE